MLSTERNSTPLGLVSNTPLRRDSNLIRRPSRSHGVAERIVGLAGRGGVERCLTSPVVSQPTAQSEAFPSVADEELVLAAVVSLPEVHPSAFERFWTTYLTLLEEQPIFVKSCTSLFGFMIGDICAQLILGSHYDIYRTLRLTLFGVLMDGPIGHCWYLFLDKNIMPETPTLPKAIVMKTALDQLLWAPFFSCVFFAFNQLFQGHPELIIPMIQNTLIPTLTANYALWPLAHLINFKFIPSEQRILYINVVQVIFFVVLETELKIVCFVDSLDFLFVQFGCTFKQSESYPWVFETTTSCCSSSKKRASSFDLSDTSSPSKFLPEFPSQTTFQLNQESKNKSTDGMKNVDEKLFPLLFVCVISKWCGRTLFSMYGVLLFVKKFIVFLIDKTFYITSSLVNNNHQ